MKSLLIIVVGSTLAGLALGTSIAYFELRPPVGPVKAPDEAPVNESIASEPLPKAVVPETVFKFGKIEHRATMQHDYEIRNEGESNLLITYMSSTCNCTGLELNGRVATKGATISVLPGESTKVMLEWTAISSAGPYRHGASLVTNDPKMPRFELEVEGQVVESTVLSPTIVQFGTMQVGEKKESSIFLLAYLDQPVEVLDYQVANDRLAEQVEVQVEPLSSDDVPDPNASGGVKVVVSYQAGKSLGQFGGSLRLETNLKNAKTMTLPIWGRVVGDISIYGPGWQDRRGLLRMGTFPSEQGKKVRLTLAVRGPHAKATRFEFDHADPPELKATLGEPREMGEQLLHFPLFVEIPAGTRPMVRLGEPASTDALIVLRSTHPITNEVRLRVQFAVGQ